ncbi:MAG: hypothetical protein GSR85_08080 [Desulfurococcales archaeon]|nr:hypothetical protein [Desulfurococcales archaeon]
MVWRGFASIIVVVILLGLSLCYLLLPLIEDKRLSYMSIDGVGVYARPSGFLNVVFYYGWLSSSNIDDLAVDMVVVSGSSRIFPGGEDYDLLVGLRSRGVEVYAYLHDGEIPIGLGSSFKSWVIDYNRSMESWVNYITGLIDVYAGLVDGVFLDECDPGYFNSTDPGDPLLGVFNEALKEIVEYARSRGLDVFINGVRAYAGLGDYYLWEGFIGLYDPVKGVYSVDISFPYTESSNPYEWVNGIAKYRYLKENGLLNKAIALTFADRSGETTALMGYYTARMLGLRGWGISSGDIYASGGPLTIFSIIDLGPLLEGPWIDYEEDSMSALFAGGPVRVDYDDVEVDLSSYIREMPHEPVVDGLADDVYDLSHVEVRGERTLIRGLGAIASASKLYLYIEVVYNGDPGAGLLHVYIDEDSNRDSGFRHPSIGVGADFMVEVYKPGSALLYRYIGGGSEWRWEQVGNVEIAMNHEENLYGVELGIPLDPINIINASTARVAVATVYSWSDDAYMILEQGDINLVEPPPTIYSNPLNYTHKYGVILEAVRGDNQLNITAVSEKGNTIRYIIYIPKSGKVNVVINNTPIKPLNPGKPNTWYAEAGQNHTVVNIIVKHESRNIHITIKWRGRE